MKSGFYLVVENSIYSCFLVSAFLETFGEGRDFLGVLSAEPVPAAGIREGRERFHTDVRGATDWSKARQTEWERLYQPLGEAGQAMVQQYGVPAFSMSHHHNTMFLGPDIDGSQVRDRVTSLFREGRPWLVTYLPQLFKPWWIEVSRSRIVNCHSAVLPYARGVHAIESIAATRNIDAFRRAVGVTIHYIDEGVDTGPVIRAERLVSPFGFQSIWELKASVYKLGIDCYTKTMGDIVEHPHKIPAGVHASGRLTGPNFRRKEFTEERKRQAEEGYRWMQARERACG